MLGVEANSGGIDPRRMGGQLGGPPPTGTFPSSTPVWNPNAGTGGPVSGGAVVVVPGGQSSGSNTLNYFNGVLSAVSQAIAAWGRNPSNQVYSGVGVVNNPNVQIAQAQAQAYQYATQGTTYGGGGGRTETPNAGGPGDMVNGIFTWAQNNTGTVILIVVGIYLLYRPSPSGRR